MKKLLIIILFVPILSFAQDDTVKIRNLSLRATDWAYIAGFASEHIFDTTYSDFYGDLRTKLKANPNAGWNTLITLDSIPAVVLWQAYRQYKSDRVDEADNNANRLSTKVEALTHPLFVSRIANFREQITSSYQARRFMGRRFLIGK